MKFKKVFWIVTIGIGLGILSKAETQTVKQDTLRQRELAKADSTMDSSGEMNLGEIEIRGSVEKPGVIIMPKRVEPELGDVELKRSFKKEVEKGVGDILKPEKELGSVERIKSIKKTVERKRK